MVRQLHNHHEIDGRLLRTGASEIFSIRPQTADLVVIESADAAAAFKHTFEVRFASGETLSLAGLSLQP